MLDRRAVLSGLGVAAMATSARSYGRIIGANDRIRLGVMGVNGRGVAHMNGLLKVPNCDVAYLIDCDSAILQKRAGEFVKSGGPPPKLEDDYRRLLTKGKIDALTVAAPDHWHAKAAIDAMNAGVHVYGEKPLGLMPAEGELMIATQKRTNTVFQMGNHQRSSIESQELVKLVRDGVLGDIYLAETWYANNRGTIGNGSEIAPPANLDWNMWQGPAPRKPYRSNLVHYNWHWFWQYGTGEICNNALHELDIARWLMDVTYPERVRAHGSRRYFQDDDWEMYDTMNLEYDYADGRMIRWSGHSCNAINTHGRARGTLIFGTKGSAIVDRNGYETFDLAGKSTRKVDSPERSATTNVVGEGALDARHLGNFIDTIRGTARVQASPIIDAHISTTLCHLGNMAYRTKAELVIDTANGRPSNGAAMKLWDAEYEPGWSPA